MQAKILKSIRGEWMVRFHAVELAYIEGASFTVQSFCARYGFKDNRHTRRVLNDLWKSGRLARHKTLYDDGHYRMVYAAQKTARLALK